MIDAKIFQHGATGITLSISRWKADQKTPAMYLCRITHESSNPDAISAERDTPLAAEREATAAFLEYFTSKKRSIRDEMKRKRPTDGEPAEKPLAPKKKRPITDDGFEY